ncbi:transposase [Streptomyces sp. HNM0663]|uniref:Transposase n=1 Tax=Streptomyces chengmaiensis TaxID=3040919 RepID=A0ABT6HI84_9ACTN|nr:transposase [Streptomyces chengmaiensis]MDH2388425.1 transposase [Streptomyces chengmaiensis]
MRIRDELGELFADAEFAEAYGTRGRPGWSPGQLALVTVLQFAENLTDRAAAHRVRYGMDLKYALGLELDDPGLDASVLSEFRTRLVEHGMEEKAFDLLLTALKDRGLVKAGGKGPWWTGYKIHISESCGEPDDQQDPATGKATILGAEVPPPHLITSIVTTDATVTDAEMTEPVHHILAARDLLPAEHFLDSGYASAELIVGVKKNFGVALVTPVLINSSPQARAGAGFDRTEFTIDWDQRQATCPHGNTSTWWSPATQRGTKAIVIKFDKETCRPCPVRDQCTRSKTGGRTLSLQPRELQEVLDHARLQQADEQWRAKYGIRAGVEGTVHQAVAVTGMRRAATSVSRRPIWSTSSPPLRSTSSASMPGGTATRSTAPASATLPA